MSSATGKAPSHPHGHLQASLFPFLCTHSLWLSMPPAPGNAVLAPSAPQSTWLLFLPGCHLLLSELCMGLVNAHTKGQEYTSFQTCRGPCKRTNAAFCAKGGLKGQQMAKEACGESSEWKKGASWSGSACLPSHRPKVLPGVSFPLRKFYFKNCLANSYSDVLDKMLSPQVLPYPEGSSLPGCGKWGMFP